MQPKILPLKLIQYTSATMAAPRHRLSVSLIIACVLANLYLYSYYGTARTVPSPSGPVTSVGDTALTAPPAPPPPSTSPPPQSTSAALTGASSAPELRRNVDGEAASPSYAPPDFSLPVDHLPSLVAFEVAATQLSVQCEVLVATAIFEGVQLLRQPQYCREKASQSRHRRAQRNTVKSAPVPLCHVAFVDWQTERLLKQRQESDLARERGEAFIGCWQLLRVGAGTPYTHPEANAIVPKLGLPRLFPSAEHSVWLDAAYKLMAPVATDCAAMVESLPAHAMIGTLEADPPADSGGGRISTTTGAAAAATTTAPAAATAAAMERGRLDASLILRRHRPLATALDLADRWWAAWAREAQRPPPIQHAPSAIAQALETSAAALLAILQHERSSLRTSIRTMLARPGLLGARRSNAAAPLARLPAHALNVAWPSAVLSERRPRTRPPETAPRAESMPRLRFAVPGDLRASARAGVHFGGGVMSGGSTVGDAERDGALALRPDALDPLPCGFLASSAFDAAAAVGGASNCRIVTLTAIFDAYDELIQPAPEALREAPADERRCFYALVDHKSQ